jgi:hypothetical protein
MQHILNPTNDGLLALLQFLYPRRPSPTQVDDAHPVEDYTKVAMGRVF